MPHKDLPQWNNPRKCPNGIQKKTENQQVGANQGYRFWYVSNLDLAASSYTCWKVRMTSQITHSFFLWACLAQLDTSACALSGRKNASTGATTCHVYMRACHDVYIRHRHSIDGFLSTCLHSGGLKCVICLHGFVHGFVSWARVLDLNV